MPLVEQELFNLLQQLSSPPVFSGIRVSRSLFLCSALKVVVSPFVLFLLAIVLSVVPRITDSDYPFRIFKIVLLSEPRGGFREGGTGAPPPPKIGKNMIFF